MPVETPDWVGNSVFYQIFPDRFARSGTIATDAELEPWDTPPTVFGFKGGDLDGVVQRLDYLQDLGVDALYFCPIFASAANHRYHTYDYLNVDPLLGGNEALRRLLDAAHDRSMKVVLDGVFNHASRGFWQFHHVLENGAASPYRDWFHFEPAFLTGQKPFQPYPFGDAATRLQSGAGSFETIGYGAWWNLPALPKFNTDCPAVRKFLFEVAEFWVRFGIDGWRLDVPNEIDDDDFWREFRSRVRAINPEAYIVGEVWGEAKRWLQGDMWDAVMNYQVTAACLGFFGGQHLDLDLTRSPSSFAGVRLLAGDEFAEMILKLNDMYPPAIVKAQLNLLDSHDMPRFLSCCQQHVPSLMLSWLFMCTIPGAPCVYYGDEVGLTGRSDPDCRKGMPWDDGQWNQNLRRWYQACIQIRRQHPVLRHGTRSIEVTDADVVVFRHELDGVHAFSVFNRGDSVVTTRLASNAGCRVELTSQNGLRLTQSADQIELVIPAECGAVLIEES